MKKGIVFFVALCFFVPVVASAQVDKILDQLRGRDRESAPQGVRFRDLRVTRVEMSPDPVRGGDPVTFQATVVNDSRGSGRVHLFLRDRDEVVSEVRNLTLAPGENIVNFPRSPYRFDRHDPCFIVEMDTPRGREAVASEREFCARRTREGWSFSSVVVGPFFVENLAMVPDPVMIGEPYGFVVELRNEGSAIEGRIEVLEGNQVVTSLAGVQIPRGRSRFSLPSSWDTFQKVDSCFAVNLIVGRTVPRLDGNLEFCVRPLGWTLKP
jgi:hypothetical protein